MTDHLHTAAWRDCLRAMNTSTDPRMQAWAGAIRFWSDNYLERKEFWMWRYFHAVLLEVDDPAASDAKYQHAIADADVILSAPPSGNYTHCGQWFALAYMRLRHKLTPEMEAKWRAALEALAKDALGLGPWGPRTRLADSDLLIGSWSLVTTVNLALGTNFREPSVEGGSSLTQWEAAIDRWIDLAEGGEWIESTQYNLGTVRELAETLLLLGTDRYPKLAAWLKQAAEQFRWQHTPDSADVVQWGDNQQPHDPVGYYRAPLYHVLYAATGERQLLDLAQKLYPTPDSGAWIALYHSILCLDPRELPETPAIEHPSGLRACKNGLVIYRTPDTLFQIFCPALIEADHQMSMWDIRAWHKGAWVIDHPVTYMPQDRQLNGSECYGFWPPYTMKIDRAELIDGGFEVAMSVSGPHLPWIYDPPPSFINRWDRLVQFQGGVLTVKDTIDAVQPTRLDRYDVVGYWGTARYEARIAPVAQFWHLPASQVQTTGNVVQLEGVLAVGGETEVETKVAIGVPAPLPEPEPEPEPEPDPPPPPPPAKVEWQWLTLPDGRRGLFVPVP